MSERKKLLPEEWPEDVRESADTTYIPVLKRIWYHYHGLRVNRGALTAATDTDYLCFTCPGCGALLRGGHGIRLEGASDHFETLAPDEIQVLVFLLHCTRCGFSDHFKMPLDQNGFYGTGKGPR